MFLLLSRSLKTSTIPLCFTLVHRHVMFKGMCKFLCGYMSLNPNRICHVFSNAIVFFGVNMGKGRPIPQPTPLHPTHMTTSRKVMQNHVKPTPTGRKKTHSETNTQWAIQRVKSFRFPQNWNPGTMAGCSCAKKQNGHRNLWPLRGKMQAHLCDSNEKRQIIVIPFRRAFSLSHMHAIPLGGL